MKLEKWPFGWAALALALAALPGCRAIEGIFKAGVWVGVVAIALLALVAFGVTRLMASR